MQAKHHDHSGNAANAADHKESRLMFSTPLSVCSAVSHPVNALNAKTVMMSNPYVRASKDDCFGIAASTSHHTRSHLIYSMPLRVCCTVRHIYKSKCLSKP